MAQQVRLECPKCGQELVGTFDERDAKMPCRCASCSAPLVYVRGKGLRRLGQEWKYVLWTGFVVGHHFFIEGLDSKVKRVADPVGVWLQKALVTSKWLIAGVGGGLGWALFMWAPESVFAALFGVFFFAMFFVTNVVFLWNLHTKYGEEEWPELSKKDLRRLAGIKGSRKSLQWLFLFIAPLDLISIAGGLALGDWVEVVESFLSIAGLVSVIFSYHWADGTNVSPKDRKLFEVLEQAQAQAQA